MSLFLFVCLLPEVSVYAFVTDLYFSTLVYMSFFLFSLGQSVFFKYHCLTNWFPSVCILLIYLSVRFFHRWLFVRLFYGYPSVRLLIRSQFVRLLHKYLFFPSGLCLPVFSSHPVSICLFSRLIVICPSPRLVSVNSSTRLISVYPPLCLLSVGSSSRPVSIYCISFF